MCPIFVGSQLSCLARYHIILWGCSLGCKNLLNFNYHTMKFHNCHHAFACTRRVVKMKFVVNDWQGFSANFLWLGLLHSTIGGESIWFNQCGLIWRRRVKIQSGNKSAASLLKSEEIETRHSQKLANNKKSTFVVLSSWNLVKMINLWDDFFSRSFMRIGQKMWIFYYWPHFDHVLSFLFRR